MMLKLIFFQHGNYAEAYERFKAGGQESYRDQKISVDYVASLRARYNVTTLSIATETHDVILTQNLRSIGISHENAQVKGRVTELLDRLEPDLIVCRTPHRAAIRWARQRNVRTLLLFADTFSAKGLRKKLRNMWLSYLFDADNFPCISNHSLNASVSVADAFDYPKNRIVPRENSRLVAHSAAKSSPNDFTAPTSFFAGELSEAKGVGDCLQAVAALRNRGVNLTFIFAGPGDLEKWRRRAASLGIEEHVHFLGLIDNIEVRNQMRIADLTVVPSRHDYDEGLPNTIFEALASRTPLIISDHPAYESRFSDGEACRVFTAADPAALASAIESLLNDAEQYALLSENAAVALDGLYLGMNWSDLVSVFLNDPENRTGWVQANSLASLGY